MFIALLSFAAATIPHYDTVAKPKRAAIVACRYAFDDLEDYVAEVNGFVWKRDVDRGGYLTWDQGNAIRYEVRMTAQPYLENIRRIGWNGEAQTCKALSEEGKDRVYETARKYFK